MKFCKDCKHFKPGKETLYLRKPSLCLAMKVKKHDHETEWWEYPIEPAVKNKNNDCDLFIKDNRALQWLWKV